MKSAVDIYNDSLALDAHHEDEGKAKEVTVRESGSVDEKV